MRTPEIIGITKGFLIALALTSASAAFAATLKPVAPAEHASAMAEVAFTVAPDQASL